MVKKEKFSQIGGKPDDTPISDFEISVLDSNGLWPTGVFTYDKFRNLYNANRANLSTNVSSFIRNNRIIPRLQAQDLPEAQIEPELANLLTDPVFTNRVEGTGSNLCYCDNGTFNPTCEQNSSSSFTCFNFDQILGDKQTLATNETDQIAKFYCRLAKNKGPTINQDGIDLVEATEKAKKRHPNSRVRFKTNPKGYTPFICNIWYDKVLSSQGRSVRNSTLTIANHSDIPTRTDLGRAEDDAIRLI